MHKSWGMRAFPRAVWGGVRGREKRHVRGGGGAGDFSFLLHCENLHSCTKFLRGAVPGKMGVFRSCGVSQIFARGCARENGGISYLRGVTNFCAACMALFVGFSAGGPIFHDFGVIWGSGKVTRSGRGLSQGKWGYFVAVGCHKFLREAVLGKMGVFRI